MKKKYIAPTVKSIKVRLEHHLATISGGGGDSFTGTLDSNTKGSGGEGNVLGKEDGEFGW